MLVVISRSESQVDICQSIVFRALTGQLRVYRMNFKVIEMTCDDWEEYHQVTLLASRRWWKVDKGIV